MLRPGEGTTPAGEWGDWLAPAEAWAILLDEGTYLGSVSTFYRVLRQAGECRERRRQATHPAARQARAGSGRAEPGMELGYHQAARAS